MIFFSPTTGLLFLYVFLYIMNELRKIQWSGMLIDSKS